MAYVNEESEKRRAAIAQMLEGAAGYINATVMAQNCGVTRQVIVADIAILRAGGMDIISTPRGYMKGDGKRFGYKGIIVCRHSGDGIRDEFYAVVDMGGVVIDVVVEHPIYGQISADLNIKSRYDADIYIEKVNKSNARMLSEVTNGVHMHNIGCESAEIFDMIVKQLKEKSILLEL